MLVTAAPAAIVCQPENTPMPQAIHSAAVKPSNAHEHLEQTTRPGRGRRRVAVIAALVLGAAALWIASDWVYWHRYLRAHSLQSFVRNPYPTLDRLYPQEAVPGVSQPRSIPVAAPAERT